MIAKPTRSASVGIILNSAVASALNEAKVEKYPPRHSSFRNTKPVNGRLDYENAVSRNVSQIRFLKPKDYVDIELKKSAIAYQELIYKNTLPYMLGKKSEIMSKYSNNEYNFIK